MNNSLTICRIEDSPFSFKDVIDLIHDSFQERLDQGLHFTCSSLTVDQYESNTKDGPVIVAYNSESSLLLGTLSGHLFVDNDNVSYAYIEYLAINNTVKRTGLATELLLKMQELMAEFEAAYMISDTACSAKSSVSWHLKNGFRYVALRSYRSTNYYSFVFRKQLVGVSKWDNWLYRNCRFSLSCAKTVLKWTKNGKERLWFKLFR